MPRAKIVPPKETKAELMVEVVNNLRARHPVNPEAAILYLLNFFTSADLVMIRDELRRKT